MKRRTFLKHCTVASGAALLGAGVEHRSFGAAKAKKARIAAVPIQSVHLTDGFWATKMTLWRRTTINDCFDKFEKNGSLDNFDRVATGKTDGHHGDPWWDGLVYEMLAGCADFLAAHPDPALEQRCDGYIARIAAAAAVDPAGYINTAVTLAQVAPRWSAPPTPGDKHDDRFPHTLYNAGCLVEAGVHYQRATGKTALLQVATRMANYMCGIMGPAPRQNIVPGHAIGEMAFFDLCRFYLENPQLRAPMAALGDGHAYGELAQFWIDNRGNHAGRTTMEAYDQDDKPVAQQANMEGHAVRSALLATGVARGAIVADRADYGAIGERWWQNMVEAKEYVTGGLGAIPAFEGFGPDYELPNNGYCETCAAVAGGFFDQEMFLGNGDARYVDALERALYNGILSGVSLSGDAYFYTNYLASGPETRRWDWHSCPCCPPMFLKMMGALPGYIYSTAGDAVYVNLYAGNSATLALPGKKTLHLQQTTNYPWDETVRIDVQPDKPTRFSLRLRIPSWAEHAAVTINGKAVSEAKAGGDGYLSLERQWKPGDTVTLTLPMPIRHVHADERVLADRGRVALQRGPIVYCLETLDCAGPVRSLILLADTLLRAEHQFTLLGGVTTLSGTAQLVHAVEDADAKPGAVRLTPAAFTAIPYYANNNRQPTTMEVWIAELPSVATPLTLAGSAVATASHVNPSDTVNALHDGVLPRSSDDDSIPRFTWWDHRGTEEWVQYDFPMPQCLSGVHVYWWDERRVKRDCRVPQVWHLEYRTAEGAWKPVENPSGYGVAMDAFNDTTFAAVETTALRLVAQLQAGWSGGILEWRVLAAG